MIASRPVMAGQGATQEQRVAELIGQAEQYAEMLFQQKKDKKALAMIKAIGWEHYALRDLYYTKIMEAARKNLTAADPAVAARARLLLCGSLSCTPADWMPRGELPIAETETKHGTTATPELEKKSTADLDTSIPEPKKIYHTDPDYPLVARKARVRGIVIIEVTIDKEGKVTAPKIIKGLPLGLSEAAVHAVKQWTFEPTLVNDKPAEVLYVCSLRFSLKGMKP
jgi:TonB family protein